MVTWQVHSHWLPKHVLTEGRHGTVDWSYAQHHHCLAQAERLGG